jgi:hypothetical protein
MMLPQIGREIPVWQDVWIFNSWLVVSSALEWAFIAFFVEFAIRRIFLRFGWGMTSDGANAWKVSGENISGVHGIRRTPVLQTAFG